VAAGVATPAQRDQARDVGCKRFVGPFYLTPNLVAGRLVPIGNMQTLVKLARLRGTADDLADLIALIEQDVGLGVRLLRYINSAYFGLLGPVRSVRHAAMMLGAKGLARWALVAACVGSRGQIPREQALIALARARTCELLAGHRQRAADPDVLFTIGMLSAVDVIFGITLEQFVRELSLAHSTSEALLHHAGRAGEILRSVIEFEHGNFRATGSDHPLSAHAEAYRAALVWAREAVSNTT
jgi:EAL and modified HD-GYP domain-containing signal transduction protein